MFFEKLPLHQKTVLLRVDFNVPLENTTITDTRRIDLTLPTLRYLLAQNCKVVLISHLGRPTTLTDLTKMSLLPICRYLATQLTYKVKFLNESHSFKVEKTVKNLEVSELLILENTRFNDLTTTKESVVSDQLAQFWANLADFYVYDAFATAHRKHTSTYHILNYFDDQHIGYGYLVKKELEAYRKFFNQSQHPLMVIIGGGKPASKIPLITKIASWVDKVLICGAIAYPFLKLQGYEMGMNTVTEAELKLAQTLLDKYRDKLVLPLDFATTKSFNSDDCIIKKFDELANDDHCLDCGPLTITHFETVLKTAKTIFWNGPPGVFERPAYTKGTIGFLQVLARLAQSGTTIVVGGGDSACATAQFGFLNAGFTHVSTGGGASLVLMQKSALPVLKALHLKL